jgi:hypothetical protein
MIIDKIESVLSNNSSKKKNNARAGRALQKCPAGKAGNKREAKFILAFRCFLTGLSASQGSCLSCRMKNI